MMITRMMMMMMMVIKTNIWVQACGEESLFIYPDLVTCLVFTKLTFLMLTDPLPLLLLQSNISDAISFAETDKNKIVRWVPGLLGGWWREEKEGLSGSFKIQEGGNFLHSCS